MEDQQEEHSYAALFWGISWVHDLCGLFVFSPGRVKEDTGLLCSQGSE